MSFVDCIKYNFKIKVTARGSRGPDVKLGLNLY